MRAGDRGHPVFAWIYDRVAGYEERHGLSELREEVLREARGRVVELGAGTGLNFLRYPQSVEEVVATEPDPHMLRRAGRAAVTAGVRDALRLGCAAIGFTIYPGSAGRTRMYEQIAALGAEAKAAGLAVVIWSYPRGTALSKAGETALDVVAYAAQIAAQLGAHIIKVKLPTEHLEQEAAKRVYESTRIPRTALVDRIRHVVQSAFDGRRIVIFSGGAREDDATIFDQVRAIRDGGGFGSIIGRNSFQRPRAEALALLGRIMAIYTGAEP